MWRVSAALFSLLFILFAGGIGGYWWFGAKFNEPGPLAEEKTIVLPRNDTALLIADRLEIEQVIGDAQLFGIGVRVFSGRQTLKAGEYLFPAHVSPREVLDMLLEGKVVQRLLTVPEGLTSSEIVRRIVAADALTGDIEATPDEGSLLPESYQYMRDTERAEMVERMRKAMSDLLAELWADRDPDLPLVSPREAIILASIVEKETGVASERPHIAGVFVNRLRRGMLLQSDPTVIYGITGGNRPLGRGLTRSELDRDTEYNTYVNPGLPPGPIANPGRASLEAVLHPMATDDLYFVADGTGGHAFAETLEEHNENVARWRRLERGGGEPEDLPEELPSDEPAPDATDGPASEDGSE